MHEWISVNGIDMVVSIYAIPTGIPCVDELSTELSGFEVSQIWYLHAFVNIKSRKNILYRRVVCVVAHSTKYTSPSFILRLITHEFLDTKMINNINNNIIDVITKLYFI